MFACEKREKKSQYKGVYFHITKLKNGVFLIYPERTKTEVWWNIRR